jgi:hypothetical protein
VSEQEKRGFSQTQELSQQLSDKNTSLNLVVVMSAVDWWKTQRHEALAVFSRRHVQWICVERFGKTGGLDTFERTA